MCTIVHTTNTILSTPTENQQNRNFKRQQQRMITSFFIGCLFKENVKKVDVTSSVQDFLTHLASWDGWEAGIYI